MANSNAPFGFKPVRTMNGSNHFQTREYSVDSSNSAKISIGDLIVLDTDDSNVTRAGASPTSGSVVGVAASALAASTAGTILVWDDPSIIFAVQTGAGTTAGGATTTAGRGANYNITDAAGNDFNISQQVVDEDSNATTATLPLRLLDLHKVVGNTRGEYNIVEVMINNHAYRGGAGAGIDT